MMPIEQISDIDLEIRELQKKMRDLQDSSGTIERSLKSLKHEFEQLTIKKYAQKIKKMIDENSEISEFSLECELDSLLRIIKNA